MSQQIHQTTKDFSGGGVFFMAHQRRDVATASFHFGVFAKAPIMLLML
jgi:hypothetical protein